MIPIFRAKTIKQDYNEWEEYQELKKIDGVWYAIGFYDCKREVKTYLGDWETTHLILIRKSTVISEVKTAEIIDISTLSIHFPDMMDSQGNKIFASLQKNGRGGDICESKWFNTDVRLTVEIESVRYSNSTMIQDGYNISRYEYKKIIGIQQ